MRAINIILGVLGFLTIVSFVAPEVGIIAAMSIIGLPIAIVLWVAPAIFFVLLISTVIFQVLPLRGKSGAIFALLICGFLLAIPPVIFNKSVESEVATLISGDLNELPLPLGAKSIAVRRKLRFGRGITSCDGFCIHALLTGTAERVLIIGDFDGVNTPLSNEIATEFSLKKLKSCPETNFRSGGHQLRLPGENGKDRRSVNSVEELKLQFSEGNCLVSRQADLKDVDLVISEARVARWDRPKISGLSLTANVINADRLTVHIPNQDGFNEVYRATKVRYKPLARILLPGPVFGPQFRASMGWLRVEQKANITGRFDSASDWPKFLSQTLKFNLALDGEKTKLRTLEKLKTVLDADRPPSREEWQAFDAYFQRVRIGRKNMLEISDFDRVLRLLQNPHFPPIARLHTLARYTRENTDKERSQKLASLLLDRMAAGVTWSSDLGVSHKKSLATLGSAIATLPDQALLPFFGKLAALSTRADISKYAASALPRLSVFGEDGIPPLLELIGVGINGGDKFYRDYQYQHPYLAGMKGLCLIGEPARGALPHMLDLMDQGKLVAHGSYGGLMVNTLVRMGANPEQIWPAYSATNSKSDLRERFEREVKRAGSKKPDCSF